MSSIETISPDASTWMDHIQENLPEKPRVRNAVVKLLLLFLRARSLPSIMLMPVRVFAQLEKLYGPLSRARFELSNVACCFPELDDETADALEVDLLKLAEECLPKEPLQKYFASTFGMPCVRTDHIVPGMSNPLMAIALSAALLTLDAAEEFILQTTRAVDDGEIVQAISDFYASHGFKVTLLSCLATAGSVLADKDSQSFVIGYTNDSESSKSHRILVTVNNNYGG